ncbi:Ubiquitin-conjugating enzyme E2 E3 [Operophtera brumata]|uniref:E2 ubiquitin-conjugating enzyme n=1 Tax=Operophtera brumata TaxID=104452 RepID=A0A0L7L6D1_OPEBR|nr:Ubiquitin-conjugating enzyme E2 E3 [Operophtera brumata]
MLRDRRSRQQTVSTRRIQKELAEIKLDPPPNCTASPDGDDLYKWVCSIEGPVGSVYEGGVFFVDMILPQSYPFDPPFVQFRTHIYHCNISCSAICLDILQNNWSSAFTIAKVVLSICSLLTDCNPADPLDGGIANLYVNDRAEHDRIARIWTKRYASKT